VITVSRGLTFWADHVYLGHIMPDRTHRRSLAGGRGRRTETAAQGATSCRDQAKCPQGMPGAEIVTEKDDQSKITLKDGSIVPARQAVGIREGLDTLLTLAPDEFRSLLALATGRPAEADPRHFESLWAEGFLEDDRSIDPVVRDVLLNSYATTREGRVIALMRLHEAADRPAAEQAQEHHDQSFENFWSKIVGPKDKGRSKD
jgi:hypothetical protein